MLITIHPKCYIEAGNGELRGSVEEVIRDKWGVPVGAYVICGEIENYINLEDVCFFEPYFDAAPVFISEDRFCTMVFPHDTEPERTW